MGYNGRSRPERATGYTQTIRRGIQDLERMRQNLPDTVPDERVRKKGADESTPPSDSPN